MQRIDFEQGAVASLRRRVAEVEGINEDLLAFARGQTETVTAIHEAVLAALAADDLETLAMILTCHWPILLKVDEVAFAWSVGKEAYRADREGLRQVEPRLIDRMADVLPSVTIRTVERGHPLFGEACAEMRSEAVIRLDSLAGSGVIALGQRAEAAVEGRHGARLLRFLGRALVPMLERWTPR